MGKIGILWNDLKLWRVGENCHLETIECPRCQSIESAYVLHCRPGLHRFHVCDACGLLIGRERWRLAGNAENPQPPAVERPPALTPTPTDLKGQFSLF